VTVLLEKASVSLLRILAASRDRTRSLAMRIDQDIHLAERLTAHGVHLGRLELHRQVKTLVEQSHRLPLGPFVGFFLTYEHLNLLSQETADGG
jgi:hypothetical protein